MKPLALTATFLLALFMFAGARRYCTAGDFVAFPESGQTFALRRDNAGYLELSFGGWGPNWSWIGLKDKVSQVRGKTKTVCTGKVNSGAEITLAATIEEFGPRQIRMAIQLTSSKDTDLTFDQWDTFRPSNDPTKPSEISMANWLEKSAGKHGRITRQAGSAPSTEARSNSWRHGASKRSTRSPARASIRGASIWTMNSDER